MSVAILVLVRSRGVLLIGLDEAGYGPLLGPLVVGAAALRVEGQPGDLRERLRGLTCRAGQARRGAPLPIPMDDSKAIKERHGVEGLSRGVRAFVVAAGRPAPSDLGDWLERFGDRPPAAFCSEPWTQGLDQQLLPLAEVPQGLGARFLLTGVEPLTLLVSPALPGELNQAWSPPDGSGNKARVLFLATSTVLVSLLESYPNEDAEVTLDRQGGRLDYADLLRDAFPFHVIERRAAERGCAAYRLRQGGREVRLTFRTRGDVERLEVGLASMAAKLTRELFMARFNAWFGQRQPGLEPTAGYVEDGRRWLADAAPVLAREGIDLQRLVRTR